MTNPRRGSGLIVVTFIVALILTVLPFPDWARLWRPQWVSLVVIYWALTVPERVNLGIAWLMGLTLDVMTGTLLGQHALALTVVAWLVLRTEARLQVLVWWGQMLAVGLLLLVNQVLVLWAGGLAGRPAQGWSYWAPSLTGALLWPWLAVVLRDLRLRARME